MVSIEPNIEAIVPPEIPPLALCAATDLISLGATLNAGQINRWLATRNTHTGHARRRYSLLQSLDGEVRGKIGRNGVVSGARNDDGPGLVREIIIAVLN